MTIHQYHLNVNEKIICNPEYNGSGEILPYLINFRQRYFEYYIVMHDSMVLKKTTR